MRTPRGVHFFINFSNRPSTFENARDDLFSLAVSCPPGGGGRPTDVCIRIYAAFFFAVQLVTVHSLNSQPTPASSFASGLQRTGSTVTAVALHPQVFLRFARRSSSIKAGADASPRTGRSLHGKVGYREHLHDTLPSSVGRHSQDGLVLQLLRGMRITRARR